MVKAGLGLGFYRREEEEGGNGNGRGEKRFYSNSELEAYPVLAKDERRGRLD